MGWIGAGRGGKEGESKAGVAQGLRRGQGVGVAARRRQQEEGEGVAEGVARKVGGWGRQGQQARVRVARWDWAGVEVIGVEPPPPASGVGRENMVVTRGGGEGGMGARLVG